MKYHSGIDNALKRIEFWIATVCFVMGLSEDVSFPVSYGFAAAAVQYTTVYLAFLLLHFVLIPRLVRKEKLFYNISVGLTVLLGIWLLLGVSGSYLKTWMNTPDATAVDYALYFFESFQRALEIVFIIGGYNTIRYVGLYLTAQSDEIQGGYKLMRRETVAAATIWLMVLFILIVIEADPVLVIIWAFNGLFAILLYNWSCNRLIPASLLKKRPFLQYLWKTTWIIGVSIIPIFFAGFILTDNEDIGFSLGMMNIFFQLFFTVPLSWIVFRRRMVGSRELNTLRQKLGESDASLRFLRSQINPHFLFNALNTLYGTAIQEHAEHTGEGIQKLGDMMRFMLEGNMKDTIQLVKEADYLNNYISFQKLRTDTHAQINITTEIGDIVPSVEIAPMLLVPFVENAFKHGISFREPSVIKISLEFKDGTLYLDVVNSKHPHQENDPEKDKSGIGLGNVKQRLELIYPEKYQLVIRDTARDFFVHLKIDLS